MRNSHSELSQLLNCLTQFGKVGLQAIMLLLISVSLIEGMIMERPMISENSAGWMAFVWISFSISTAAMAIGIFQLPVDAWIKGYLGMGLMFNVGSCFTLSKTVRDNHEARKLINRVSEAKTERILHDFELKDVIRNPA